MTSLEPVIDCGFNKTGFSEVVSHDFRLAHHNVGKLLLHCARNLAVQLLPAALEQTLICRIPHQRVLEAIDSFRWLATAEHELSLLEFGESMLQCGFVASGPTRASRNRKTHARWLPRFGRYPSPAPGGRAAPSRSLEGSPEWRAEAEARQVDSRRRL